MCNIISAQQMSARVVGGTADAGRLEILYDGTWGTVCGERFGQREALVACRMLGFNSTTAVAMGRAKYGAGSGPILFGDLQCVGNETSLALCKHSGLYRRLCDHWLDVGVACNFISAQQMSARVVGGTADAGRLEILYDGTWNTVCDVGFEQTEALVACRMLGFNSTTAAAVGSTKYGAGSGPILFDNLRCVGNETSLAQCEHPRLYRHNCGHSQVVGVMCNIAQHMSARVVGGTADTGRLEILYDGTWSTVCGNGFGQEEALVACRMLGFNSTTAVAVGSDKYGAGSGPILFSDLRCVGNETSLAQCQHWGFYTHYCGHWEDVGVMCNITQQMSARVVGGTADAGRLEILYDGTWSTVCGIGFGQEEALVACRMLGFNSTTAVPMGSNKYGAGSGPILFYELRCVGNETSLAQCEHWEPYIDNCGHTKDIGVMCNFTQQMSARVVGGTADAGRLEILYDGTWGTVCDILFGQEEALVACRMLGFNSTTAVAVGSGKYGAGSGPILFSYVQCVGNETSLAQCQHLGLYKHDCEHWWDVGVMCNITTPMTARLSGGTSTAGRLEISVKGEWTTVCQDRFEQSEVEVACRMLGFNSTGQATVKYLLENDGSRFQFDYMWCQGMETDLQQCKIGQLNKSSCLDVGIIYEFNSFSLRLTGPRRTDSNMGRVEVKIGSKQFSTVCVNNEKTAAVICRQLNLTSNFAELIDGWVFEQDSRPLLQATFVCEGSESSLDECGRSNTAEDCYSDDVGVYCNTDKRLLIVSRDERYPFIEGANKALKCVTPRKYQRLTEYTWEDTAGGRPNREFLVFDNLTKEYNGLQVRCYTNYRERKSDSTYSTFSDVHVLKVYYKPLITITWTNNTGEQQPLSSLSELNPGHNVTLWCKADSNPPPASITWSGRGNSTTGELRILAADHVTHSGVYTCTVVTETVDDDDRLPLTSSYRLTLSVQGLHLLSLFCFVLFCSIFNANIKFYYS
ncbi:deleted in malignant brain tumors 1 protein-like [Pomacea canaliculata]|uniref:deleted in malignant brain tumors 1 protein-like n=1 Tax=Pomacea canaliculata TaxID=400727 RepID=UPI000D732B24|nr:deleted in malignant brain tumors 1 protein-like [Pomacea canaliculata]